MSASLRLAAAACAAAALSPAPARPEEAPIQDNSFLIEEAYNQEPGVIQHISTFNRSRGGAWAYTFTEEWPVGGQTHQASVTFAYAGAEAARAGIGDLALNYRWQAIGDGEADLALAPRLTLLLPTGDARRGLGNGGTGLQINLPLSAVLSRALVTHLNLAGTWVPSAAVAAGGSAPMTGISVGQGLVWLAHQHLNLLVEALYGRTDLQARDGRRRTESLFLSPGLRAAIDAGGLQIVPGLALPVGVGPSAGEMGLFFYLSFEHPFGLAGPTAERGERLPRASEDHGDREDRRLAADGAASGG